MAKVFQQEAARAEQDTEDDCNHAEAPEYVRIGRERLAGIEHLPGHGIARGELGDQARHILCEGGRQEPAGHHEADNRSRRQLGDHRQADRRQAQLAGRMEQVGEHQEDQRHAVAFIRELNTPDQNPESEANLDERQRKLQRRIGVRLARAEPGPERGEDRREQQDETGVETLRLRCRDGHEAIIRQLRVAFGKLVQRRAALLEQRPENDRHEDQEQGKDQFLDFAQVALRHHVENQVAAEQNEAAHQREEGELRGLQQEPDGRDARDGEQVKQPFEGDRAEFPRQQFRIGRRADMFRQLALTGAPEGEALTGEDEPAERHTDSGQAEARPPANSLAEIAAQDGRPEGAEVDAVIVKREAGVAARIIVFVKLADDRGNVGLQVADAHHDQGQGEEQDVRIQRIAYRLRQCLHHVWNDCRHRAARFEAGEGDAALIIDVGAAAIMAFVAAEQAALRAGLDEHLSRAAPAFDRQVVLGAIDRHRLRCLRAVEAHRQVSRDEQQRAECDGLAVAEVLVREEAAEQRQKVDQRRVGAILALRRAVIEQEMLGQVEDQQAAHAIEGEALPHLGEEQDVQAPGMLAHLVKDRDTGRQCDDNAQNDNQHERLPSALSDTDRRRRPDFMTGLTMPRRRAQGGFCRWAECTSRAKTGHASARRFVDGSWTGKRAQYASSANTFVRSFFHGP